MTAARLHADGKKRCPWPGEDPFYMAYHDTEWGVPDYDDRALYEKLILDGFQAGLSWITILRKRENFRKAFDDFQPEKIARYNAKKVHALRGRPAAERAVGGRQEQVHAFCRYPAGVRGDAEREVTRHGLSPRSRPPGGARRRS